MNPESADRRRLRRVSRIMSAVSLIGMGLVPAIMIGVWAFPVLFERFFPVTVRAENLTLEIRLLGAALSLMVAMISVYGFARLRTLFRLTAAGEYFSVRTVACLRGFAGAVAGSALAHILLTPVLSVLLTLNNPPGERQFVLSLSSQHVMAFFLGAVFLVIAWILSEGQRIAQENAEIV